VRDMHVILNSISCFLLHLLSRSFPIHLARLYMLTRSTVEVAHDGHDRTSTMSCMVCHFHLLIEVVNRQLSPRLRVARSRPGLLALVEATRWPPPRRSCSSTAGHQGYVWPSVGPARSRSSWPLHARAPLPWSSSSTHGSTR